MNEVVSEKIGFLGLGKLGLPCAAAASVATEARVYGFDLNPSVRDYIEAGHVPYQERHADRYLSEGDLVFCESVEELVDSVDILFLAIQTPHEALYEGISPVPDSTRDFDYEYLKSGVRSIVHALEKNSGKDLMVVVISTVLPGTMRREIFPLIPENLWARIQFAYNPFFIAMGTTIFDYLNPEFILIGCDDRNAGDRLARFYNSFLSAPVRVMEIESAELTKVAYNTFIGFKIVFSNAVGEIVDAVGGKSSEVLGALSAANGRLMSAKYMSPGMGDGGGCHPRDQIAMSWLAERHNLSANPFDWLSRARDNQTLRQAETIQKWREETELPVVILGMAYKANVNLTIGSPSILLGRFLEDLGIPHIYIDPVCEIGSTEALSPSIFFHATNHDVFANLQFPAGSVVIDPWGVFQDVGNEVSVIALGTGFVASTD